MWDFGNKQYVEHAIYGIAEDNMKDIANCDWIIEVVVERLDIKKLVFEQVDFGVVGSGRSPALMRQWARRRLVRWDEGEIFSRVA